MTSDIYWDDAARTALLKLASTTQLRGIWAAGVPLRMLGIFRLSLSQFTPLVPIPVPQLRRLSVLFVSSQS